MTYASTSASFVGRTNAAAICKSLPGFRTNKRTVRSTAYFTRSCSFSILCLRAALTGLGLWPRNDPQLRANEIVVPLEGAGEKLTSTISSPIQVHGVTKVPARRAPGIGEHNEEVLKELGFNIDDIVGLRASGAIPQVQGNSVAAD
jgi:hypothetical protein